MKLKTMILTICCAVLYTLPLQAADVIEEGKTVDFEYTLTVDGEVVDTSEGKAPLEYVHGQGQIIPGLSRQLEGLKKGDEKKITVSPEEGYGLVRQDAFIEFPKENVTEGVELEIGKVLQLRTDAGQTVLARIADIKGEKLLLDLNHPLAGKELKFDVKIVDIK